MIYFSLLGLFASGIIMYRFFGIESMVMLTLIGLFISFVVRILIEKRKSFQKIPKGWLMSLAQSPVDASWAAKAVQFESLVDDDRKILYVEVADCLCIEEAISELRYKILNNQLSIGSEEENDEKDVPLKGSPEPCRECGGVNRVQKGDIVSCMDCDTKEFV